jgi:hypothetical protein
LQCSDGQNREFGLFKLIEYTNHDIQHTACHHVVHILQYPRLELQHSQQKVKWSILQNRIFRHYWWLNMTTGHGVAYNNITKHVNPRAAWKHKWSELSKN